MTDVAEKVAVESVLELRLEPGTLTCSGVLNRRNRYHLLDAVQLLLEGATSPVTVDISGLRIEDVDGANALAHVQRVVREEGMALVWRGLRSERLKGILPLRAAGHRVPSGTPPPYARWHPAAMPPIA